MALKIHNHNMAKLIASRRWIRRLGLFDLPEMAPVSSNGHNLYVDLSDWKGPSYHVLNWGIKTYENSSADFLLNYFKSAPQGVFFDIGANIGIFSFILGSEFPEAQIFAFEPEPVSFGCLKRTFSAEKFANVRTYNIALSDKEGTATLFFDKNNHGGHSLQSLAITEEGSEVGGSVPTRISTLDAFTANNNINRLDFIKMDVQRHEAEVLAGSLNTIKKFRPVCLMECYFSELLEPDSDLIRPFQNNDYKVVEMSQQRILDITPENLKSLKSNDKLYCDLAFVPHEVAATFLPHTA